MDKTEKQKMKDDNELYFNSIDIIFFGIYKT